MPMPLEKPSVGKLGISKQMPTTQETLLKAARTVEPLLPENFYGSVRLIWDRGNFVRAIVEQSLL